MTLSGKRAFVTGGGTGIGAAIALQLAEAGADVVITGRREEPLIETAAKSSKIAWHVMDASDETSIIDAMTAADDIDIMVANAGIADTSPVAKITMDHWRKVFATNVEGVMVCTREAVRQMVPRGWGRIIIVSSVAGLKGAPYIGAYSASKHAVLGLMKSAADETMTKGVTVNAICPAYVLTELVQKGIDNIVEKTGVTAEEATQQLANVNPFKRLIETDEVAAAAMWLCGPGSGAITGQAIPVSGGQV
ncbi:MAG: SDR family NAD(P)-dependent oxidoreductase [Paracoccaceae bacterium]|jgi:3-hydroxybutyrate dehydrogenase|nr:SDR family NAD(P)-dependent oxidoreductase [Paracoccaceae bacterium]MDG1371338.1 SDR family NAD(P)-dependent oxidoreductase [Paracoccaceae bacterium]